MALADPDHDLALSAADELASDGTVEEAVAQSIDDHLLDVREHLGGLAAMGPTRCGYGPGFIHRADVFTMYLTLHIGADSFKVKIGSGPLSFPICGRLNSH